MSEELEVALENIKTVCMQFRGTKQEHVVIETNLQTIEDSLKNCNCKSNNKDKNKLT